MSKEKRVEKVISDIQKCIDEVECLGASTLLTQITTDLTDAMMNLIKHKRENFKFKPGDIVKFIGHESASHVEPFLAQVRDDSDEDTIYLMILKINGNKVSGEKSILSFRSDGTLFGFEPLGCLLVKVSGLTWNLEPNKKS